MHVNLGMSLRKTKYALKELYNIDISHQQIANYCKTAAICIKPFVDNYDYKAGTVYTADETYIKIRGLKSFVWFIMDAASRSIIGYRISSERDVGACILAMRDVYKRQPVSSYFLLKMLIPKSSAMFLLLLPVFHQTVHKNLLPPYMAPEKSFAIRTY